MTKKSDIVDRMVKRFNFNEDRDDMINYLTSSHGLKPASLDGMGDSCLTRTFVSFAMDDPMYQGIQVPGFAGYDAEDFPALSVAELE